MTVGWFLSYSLIRPQEYYSSPARTSQKKTEECKVWTSQCTIDRLRGSKRRSGDSTAVIINIEINKTKSTWGYWNISGSFSQSPCLQQPCDRWIPSVNKHREMAVSEARNIAEPLPRHLLSAVITCWNAKHAGITQAPALLDESPLIKPTRDSTP